MRGQIEIKSLAWDGKNISVILNSVIKQKIQLQVPDKIESILADGKVEIVRDSGKTDRCSLSLPSKEDVKLTIVLIE